jgi:hypothetical protein
VTWGSSVAVLKDYQNILERCYLPSSRDSGIKATAMDEVSMYNECASHAVYDPQRQAENIWTCAKTSILPAIQMPKQPHRFAVPVDAGNRQVCAVMYEWPGPAYISFV